MTLDPISTARLVTREVRTGQRDGLATRIVVARRTYGTDQQDLWDAVTNPERLPRWFLPVTGELSLGGRYQIEGNAGGYIQRCDEPERFEVTWEYEEQVSWLTVTLSAAPGGTVFELAHEAPVDPDFWAQYGPGAAGIGWDLGLLGLGLHVDTGEPVDPMYADDWAATEDGIAFVRLAADGWAEAAVADGDDPTSAREAALETVTFYTVPPEA
jgi:uncharacterized protein YndB with AHSA1/START domain